MGYETDCESSIASGRWIADPRHAQIAVLGALLLYGFRFLDFPVTFWHLTAAFGSALGIQGLAAGRLGLPFDWRSPAISALSLTLLCRASHPIWLGVAAAIAIGSKFLLRRNGKHIFNPTNFGLVVLAALTPNVWISPGQWGAGAVLGLLLAGSGFFVVFRAARSDVTVAFLATYGGIVLLRAAWLGDPWAVPLHHLQNGALLIFAFFMISDPKTTPNSRAGRVVFAALVALGGAFVHFGLFRPNGFLWSLVVACPLVPWLDRIFPGERYRWPSTNSPLPSRPSGKENVMQFPSRPFRHASGRGRRSLQGLGLLLAIALAAAPAQAFCGFYVARAGSKLFNESSQVVLVRDGDRTVLTMANDYQGDPKEFAVVIPVPTFIEREQIHVASQSLIDHLDAYTAPRLVEYHDENPCWLRENMDMKVFPQAERSAARSAAGALGVEIEATYTVGEYDILILSAQESRGLETWLRRNDYRIPDGASRVLESYLKQNMRFFVARVNLDEHARLGFANLRPLQVAYESPKFMLPIRLGTVNAKGDQELFVYALTRNGRVETTNYRTVRLPTGMDLPVFVKDDFGNFYRDMFRRQVETANDAAVFLEYAWDMAWCDPCAANPLSPGELRELGVFWIAPPQRVPPKTVRPQPPIAQDVFVTRLHVRYNGERFPADLQFQQTGDRTNFQGRYVLRHPWTGGDDCGVAEDYRRQLAERRDREAATLADLTGWDLAEIRERMNLSGTVPASEKWWKRIWPGR